MPYKIVNSAGTITTNLPPVIEPPEYVLGRAGGRVERSPGSGVWLYIGDGKREPEVYALTVRIKGPTGTAVFQALDSLLLDLRQAARLINLNGNYFLTDKAEIDSAEPINPALTEARAVLLFYPKGDTWLDVNGGPIFY